jgi:glycosyltransferase involved in cell wall biosynthesis
MITFEKHKIEYSYAHTAFYDFSNYDSIASGDFIFISTPINFHQVGVNWVKNNKIVYLETEEPNRFFSDGWFNHLEFDPYFRQVFSICPYTCEYLNAKYNNQIRTPVFIPFNEKTAPQDPMEKLYDVIYTGHLWVGGEVQRIANAIIQFNYRLVANSDDPRATNRNVSNVDKLRLVAQSKISVVHNLLFLSDDHVRNAIRNAPGNEAFTFAESHKIAPQIKGRVFEAAFCRSLILCLRDPFNVIEQFFAPEEEFVYYDEGSLAEKITEILSNYEKYEEVIENAYQRAINEYTVSKFVDKYLVNIDGAGNVD